MLLAENRPGPAVGGWRQRLTLCLLPLLAACSHLAQDGTDTRLAGVSRVSVELAAVPFFPQQEHECGPAALATVLVRAGVAISPEALADEVYLPGRKGTLSAEVVASVRRHGRLPEILPPHRDVLLNAVASGHPVLVLQNLGLDWLPLWHYAVVVGYDLGAREIWLRSGAERRQSLSLFTFDKTWSRAGGFALIVLRPEEMPIAATAPRWLAVLAEAGAPAVAWETAARRWPDEAQVWFGLGNARQADPEPNPKGAERAWRETLRLDANFIPAYNNLALALAAQGRAAEARQLIDQALALLDDPSNHGTAALRAQVVDSRQQILSGRVPRPTAVAPKP
jgi:hypothetical protein